MRGWWASAITPVLRLDRGKREPLVPVMHLNVEVRSTIDLRRGRLSAEGSLKTLTTYDIQSGVEGRAIRIQFRSDTVTLRGAEPGRQ